MKERLRVVALIPAHNEEATVKRTIDSLRDQCTKVIVVSDNSTDNTALVAAENGAIVFHSQDNKHKKAGALNQAIAHVLPSLDDDDLLLVVDADSDVGGNFVTDATKEFLINSKLGGLSGSYQGRAGGGVVGWFQRNEIARWGFDDEQANGKTVILSGASSAFRVATLRDLLSWRGFVYDEASITEDFELSMALLHRGWQIKKLLSVIVTTAVKPSWGSLHVQRLRWDRGINDALLQYGFTKHTAMVWIRRVIYGLQCLATVISAVFLMLNIIFWQSFSMGLFWLVVAGIIAVEKVVTLRKRGVYNMMYAATLVGEMPYDLFLMTSFVKAIFHTALKRETKWR